MEEEVQKTSNSNGATNGWGIASLVFGIISIVFLFFIIISVISAILAIVFGIIGIKKGDKSLGKTGLMIGSASIILTILLYLFLGVLDVSLFFVPSWYK